MQARGAKRLAGTGTMQAQTPLDVFGQFRALDPGIFGRTWTAFRARYAEVASWNDKVVVGYKNEDELAAKIASITFHAGEDVLDLPDVLPDIPVEATLEPSARKWYDELWNELYVEVRRQIDTGVELTDETTADNVLVKMLRCQQLTGGHLQLDSGELAELSTVKRKLLEDELEDIDPSEPVIVFGKFHPDLDNIEKVAGVLGRTYGELSGRRSDALAGDATLADGITIAGVQIQSGGTGVDFTKSAFGIYYSVGHSLGDYLQSRKRLVRPGQTRSVRFRHLVLTGTIDELVYEALRDRQSVVTRIANKVKELQKTGGKR